MHILSPLLRLSLILGLAALTGCSSFNRQWKHALAEPAPVPASGITGPWEGSWISEVNGHHGPLRCLISPGTNGTYQAWFHAKYKKIITLSFAYKVTLQPTPSARDDQVLFHGEENLGKLAGGVYTYQGHAGATNFFSTYHNRYDHGTFRMTRPAPLTGP